MTSYASATAAWTPPKLEAHPDPSLLTTSTDSDSVGIKSTKDALEYTPPLTPPITTEDQDKLSNQQEKKKEEKDEEAIPGSVFDHVIPGVKVMETRQLPDDLEKKIAKPCQYSLSSPLVCPLLSLSLPPTFPSPSLSLFRFDRLATHFLQFSKS